MDNSRYRIGIDVGGTFTHAVAVDDRNYGVAAHAVVPTTHKAKNGVSEGIVEVFKEVIKKINADVESVIFVAHSTTQATNALLEGDVAKVGIVGMGRGFEGVKAKCDTNIKDIELSHGKYLNTEHVYLNTSDGLLKDEKLDEIIKAFKEKGCEVIVSSEAFGVDDTSNEDYIQQYAVNSGIPATSSHEISQLYGLKIRTRTAVINASILPKMTQTADMTEESIKKSGIKAPLMIMRSDGGVMDIEQMKKRPVLTMLSGPAAGIAAALMFAKVSDGIFLEVGGTSTDISAIKNGKAMIKSAKVGGHRTYLKTLDSRTLGIGGGSMIRASKTSVIDVGPRSAHIAGFSYVAFAREEDIEEIVPQFISPKESDPDDYLVFKNKNGQLFALTLTDAGIYTGMIKEGDYAFGNRSNVEAAFNVLGKFLGCDPMKFAHEILGKAALKVSEVVEELLSEYKMDRELVSLVGGGGGATAVVPGLSKKMNMKYIIAEKAEVISAIGAALAMLRETIEKTVMNPTEEDIDAIRKQVQGSLVGMGADINTIEVSISVDNKRNILSAVATGSIQMENQEFNRKKIELEEAMKITAESMRKTSDELTLIGETDNFWVISAQDKSKGLFGLFTSIKTNIRVIDKYGIIRLQINDACYTNVKAGNAIDEIGKFVDKVSNYNDAGRTVPNIFLIYGGRTADLSALMDFNNIMNMVAVETKGLEKNEKIIVISQKR